MKIFNNEFLRGLRTRILNSELMKGQGMKLFIRIAIVFVFLAVFVGFGVMGVTWASKLTVPSQTPVKVSPSSQAQALGVGSNLGVATNRPNGTVSTSNSGVHLIPNQAVSVGSCSTVFLKSAPANSTYTAFVADKTEMAQSYPSHTILYPGNLMSCLIKIQSSLAVNQSLQAEILVCFPISSPLTGFTYNWDGNLYQWVKSALPAQARLSCVDIPASVINPVYAVLFDK